jgi:hypothetical protein
MGLFASPGGLMIVGAVVLIVLVVAALISLVWRRVRRP